MTLVHIDMQLPAFAVEMARQRLSKRHFARATTQAELYANEDAVDAGYLDRVVDTEALLDAAHGEAARLAALNQGAFAATKARVHGPLAERLRETLTESL